MKKCFSLFIVSLMAIVSYAKTQPVEYAAYCSARYEKDAKIWAMSVYAIDENLYTSFFIKDNVEPSLVELPQSGTYSTDRGNLTFNSAYINRTELEVDSIVITLAETTPVGALNADMMMYLQDGTIYHLIAEPTCEGISGTDSIDFQYGSVNVFQSDPGAQAQMVQMLATVGKYTYAIMFKNTTLATLPGTYGDGDWQELLTGVSYIGYESKNTYEWPCSVSAVVDDSVAHVVMHMWDGVEYTLNFHYAEPKVEPAAIVVLYDGSKTIELKGNDEMNYASHIDSVGVTFVGFEPDRNMDVWMGQCNEYEEQGAGLMKRDNNSYIALLKLDLLPSDKQNPYYKLQVRASSQPWDYHSFRFRVQNPATGIAEVEKAATPAKRIVNGQLLIVRDGKSYNVTGAEVK